MFEIHNLDRPPMKHAEYREQVIDRQIRLLYERGVWVYLTGN